MLAALRSLLPKTWSTTHETAWEWLWATISRNLSDSSSKVRAFKVYNAQLFGALKEEHLNTFRNDLYTDFFAKCAISQDIFKQSQTRLHYIADRVLQSSYDMFHKPKQEMVDELSALGLRHVGYGVPIELFAPFTDSCVQVIKTVAASMPKSESTKIVACAVAGMTQAEERDVPEHMMVEGFRWSIGLVARLLMRIITEGSTAVMQAIYQDSAKLLQAALKEAPREYRNFLQLRVRVGSQSISPLYWALRSGAHTAARTMLEDVLTIRADRDRYYYGVNDIFKFQPDIAADLLQEAPKLVNVFLDGLIWRSHKTKEGQRPVVYYMEHLLQDPDDEKMISRAFVSFVRFRNPKIIVHPILIFVSDLVWNKLVRSYFMYDQIFRMINFVIFILAGCFLNQPTVMRDPVWSKALVGVRVLVYTMGFAKLLYSHVRELYRSSTRQDWKIIWRVRVPTYLLKGPEMLSFMLMLNMASMMVVEPMIHCFGTSENFAEFQCENWTDDMSLAYEVFLVIGIFLYVFLIFGIGSSISIEISEYRVLCMSAVKQVALCLGVVTLAIFTFGFVITAMTREAQPETGQSVAHMAAVDGMSAIFKESDIFYRYPCRDMGAAVSPKSHHNPQYLETLTIWRLRGDTAITWQSMECKYQ
ncbi:Retrovirus-related Pol polyprotein from transposon TNT 1-94 [Durusdinium trenchii]|uniref:Retrovirus-related Pol polyprotein from transposon TNT 1-94 n=1 Tax=Durusdinium trenchii TaxID=1381693 RepID=A0ABP0LGK4_9DINO